MNGDWTFQSGPYEFLTDVPASVYSVLTENGIIDDLYFGDNELRVIDFMKEPCVFRKTFSFAGGFKALLCFDGIDTVSRISLNGKCIGETCNMHRKYEFDITGLLEDENEIKVEFPAIYRIFEEKYREEAIYTEPSGPLAGAKNIRKSFCMSGWDWAPRLADMGIWKDVYLLDLSTPAMDDVEIRQKHTDGKVFLTVSASVKNGEEASFAIELLSPDGKTQILENNRETEIESPMLWWPNGYGEQYLYTVTVSLIDKGQVFDVVTKRIGLRTMELVREPDEYGESYYHRVNGKPVFAMGACYVPEDILFTKITRERTERLLNDCLFANFNTLRVWGGGHYPHDFFYELCDEKGILVFEDMMYACSNIPANRETQEEFLLEAEENLKRIRHHACLAVICGNNEMELWTHPDDVYGKRYLELFENRLPKVVKAAAGEIPFVTSSPTSKGGFRDPNNDDCGDQHCWEVWAKGKSIYEYRKHMFRYLSEFGLSAFPDEKTVNAFTSPEDRNAFSRVMELHQRCVDGNKIILSYIASRYRLPCNLSDVIYLSQLVQAEAVACGAEHQRANRGCCMGALYWQLNDIWPCVSFSGIDYFGRYKAVQYFAKRFFAPISVICEETGECTTRESVIQQSELYDYTTTAQLFVSNETGEPVTGQLRWELRNAAGEILQKSVEDVTVKPRSVYKAGVEDFHKTDVNRHYISYSFTVGGEVVASGTKLFTAPKYFGFIDPRLMVSLDGDRITVRADAFAKSVQISSDSDLILSDNYFDLNAESKTVKILSGKAENVAVKSLYDLQNQ